MIGKLLCTLGFHGREGWISPAKGGGYWRSSCPRCGCDLTRDSMTGRWAETKLELAPQAA